ncbi:MAG: hypothetical protein U0793_11415 [Gemmataceae bacterium]|mgnify:CR=1 FL=1
MDRADWLSTLPTLLTSSVELWLSITYIVCMFVVTAFRPQQISSVGLFRMSYILFTLYLIIPSLVNTVIAIIHADRRNLGRPLEASTAELILVPLFQAFAKVLFAIAVLCALSSLRHYQRRDLPPVMDDR